MKLGREPRTCTPRESSGLARSQMTFVRGAAGILVEKRRLDEHEIGACGKRRDARRAVPPGSISVASNVKLVS